MNSDVFARRPREGEVVEEDMAWHTRCIVYYYNMKGERKGSETRPSMKRTAIGMQKTGVRGFISPRKDSRLPCLAVSTPAAQDHWRDGGKKQTGKMEVGVRERA